jgi:hypothetical protein
MIKALKQKEYAERIRQTLKPSVKPSSSTSRSTQPLNARPPQEIQKAALKVQKAKEYAKHIPKPPASTKSQPMTPLPRLQHSPKTSMFQEHQKDIELLQQIKKSLLL